MLARDKGKGDLLPEKSGEIKELLEKKNYKKLFISIAARLIIFIPR